MIFDKNLCACVEKKQKSNSSTLADSKGKRVRENKMYMISIVRLGYPIKGYLISHGWPE
jgi:hypothetical protein